MKTKHLFILIILPAVMVLAAALLRYSSGPYWIGYNCDPEYAYLIHSLAQAESKEIPTNIHPGTTLSMLGTVTLQITHALDLYNQKSLEISVFKKPEFYLSIINIVLISLNAVILVILGIVSFSLTKNIWLCLLLQSSPFMSNELITQGLSRVTPEPLVLFSSLLLILILIEMTYRRNLSKSVHWYVIALALVSSFGMATKITFAPLLIIPLFALPVLRNKILFLFLTGLFFVLWTWPIVSQYKVLFTWYYQVLNHNGFYGFGDSGIIDTGTFFTHITYIILRNPLFSLTWVFSAGFILMFIWPYIRSWKAMKEIFQNEIYFRILLAIVVAQLCSILITAKHPPDRNLLPALCLSSISLFLMFMSLKRMGYLNHLKIKIIIVFASFFFILSGIWRIIDIKNVFMEKLAIKNEALIIYQLLDNQYKHFKQISYAAPYPRSSAPIDALAWGNFFIANGLYSGSLQRLYGEAYFYNIFMKKFHTWTKEFSLKDIVLNGHGGEVVIYGPPLPLSNNYLMSYVDSNPDSWKKWLSIEDFRLKDQNHVEAKPGRIDSMIHLKDIFDGTYETIYVIEGITINK